MGVNGVNSDPQSQAIVIARLQEQNNTLFDLARETRDELKRIRETFENGCVFGRVLRADFDELKASVKGSDTRLTELEHTRAALTGKWGGVAVMGALIGWAITLALAIWTELR